ncbi:hypothetical protein D9757_007478 [Collybiopsis confluens]|uniref:Protein kinase domain-containing protein n=1 Tax=Collybiopsis confluens TaxID=2823264 RepID=A0A8H5HJC8_9AGAR|nr:hypothetical protein D9757_007478 [Collybiopsis confluens]
MSYELAPLGQAFLGKGSFSQVYKATEISTAKFVALKKSRASKKLQRTLLQYEARLLQLLQGHRSIPFVYAYGHLHFEYLAMELLGPSLADKQQENCTMDLSPRDDLESLAYIALYLLRGSLPWKPRPRLEDQIQSHEIVRLLKLGCSAEELSSEFPPEFCDLLTNSRSLKFGQLPDYTRIRDTFADLAKRKGFPITGPLDWRTHPGPTYTSVDEPEVSVSDEDMPGDDEDSNSSFKNSYFAWDIDQWDDRQGERDKDLTLPENQITPKQFGSILPITEVLDKSI